jgi:hypothetical protein
MLTMSFSCSVNLLDDKSEFFNQTSIDETFLNQNPLPASLLSTPDGVVVIISEKHPFPRQNDPFPTGLFNTLMGLPSHAIDQYPLSTDLFSIPVG